MKLVILLTLTLITITGQPAAGWFPNERISIEEALRAYTYGAAYANFELPTFSTQSSPERSSIKTNNRIRNQSAIIRG